ncbi:FAD:protein FMN transferase [hydrothermal vent metagenome]|uniref:FAD:protein FMN transferase n=1 Tax=hydrothermal vent metagenome TaxID=652676 RepID=A0A3B0X783_9ZZZZ
MLKNSALLALLLTFMTISACEKAAEEHHYSSLHFGTLIDITLYDVSAIKADAVFKKLDEDFALLHTSWSPWEAGSLKRTNMLIETGKAFSVGPSILTLIEKSAPLSANTEHLFNPAIGRLINLWQFHKHNEKDIKPPADEAIRTLVAQNPQLSDLKIDGIKMHSENTAVSLNFGAFAKGYAIDLEMQQVKDMGIKNAIINAGGDLKAIGSHGKRPWRIAIQHPRQKTWLAQLNTHGEESVFTSGDYERFYLYKGKRYHHILDPRTGYPATGTQSVTVLHTDSALADAAATALFIAGPDHWMDIARKLNLRQVMLVDQQGTVYITPEMRARIQFNPQIETTIITTSAL